MQKVPEASALTRVVAGVCAVFVSLRCQSLQERRVSLGFVANIQVFDEHHIQSLEERRDAGLRMSHGRKGGTGLH